MLDGAVSVAPGREYSLHSETPATSRSCWKRYEHLIAPAQAGETTDWRVIHASLVSPVEFSRFGASNIIAEVNPYHASAIPWLRNIVGEPRTRWAFAFRSLQG